MQGSRFVLVSTAASDTAVSTMAGEPAAVLMWMLVSPNNRPIGRAARTYPTYSACLDAVRRLRENHLLLRPVTSTVERSGRWAWRADVDGQPVAVSSRSYLRMRECQYNLERFLEAVPSAAVVPGTRAVRGGRPTPMAETPRTAERTAP